MKATTKWLKANWASVNSALNYQPSVYSNRGGISGSCAIVEVKHLYIQFSRISNLVSNYGGTLTPSERAEMKELLFRRGAEKITQHLLSKIALFYSHPPHLMYVCSRKSIGGYVKYLTDIGWKCIKGTWGPHTPTAYGQEEKLLILLYVPKKRSYYQVEAKRERFK